MNMQRALSIFPALLAISLLGGCATDPATLTPGLQYQGGAGGCGDIYITSSNAARTEYLVIDARRDQLALGTAPKTFDLAQSPGGLSITIDLYAYAPTLPKYCNDVISANDLKPATWKAISGSATITLSTDSIPSGNTYTATVTLKNVVFRDPSGGRQVTLAEQMLKNVVVGWYPG
ncbi:MAG: hypothetical protein JWQ98_1896 [Chlorobi bacterium]|nr:hypothetical protein [Chlorobiota bacterium]